MPFKQPLRPKQIGTFGKVRLLLWKNFLIQKRHWVHTIFDLPLPIGLFSLIILIHWRSGKTHTGPRVFSSQNIDHIPSWAQDRFVYYAPNNTIFNELMTSVENQLNLSVIGVQNIKEYEETILANDSVAVEFHHSNDDNKVPENLSYSLRFPAVPWETDRLFDSDQFSSYGRYMYLTSSFLAIQNAIAKAFINKNKPSSNIPNVVMQQFPIPAHTENFYTDTRSILIPILFLISFDFAFINSVRYITNEKEKQLKEAMKIMGLANWMQHLSWFIRTIVMILIPVVVIAVAFTIPIGDAGAIFPNSDVICLFVFLFGFILCLVTFGFLVSSFFTRTKAATIAAGILWYATISPFYVTNTYYDDLSGWLKLLLCLLPNTAVSYGFKIIARLEYLGVGLNWSTAFQTVSVYDNLSVAIVFAFLIGDAILLFLITVYMENVFPGQYGVAKPWNFFLRGEFWGCGKSQKGFEQFENNSTGKSQSDSQNFENEISYQRVGIEIRNMTKKFTSDKAAVDNLSLNIYENQITCLLGQNGAGKTTTISMLTGMMQPTSGTAKIDGHDIRTNMDSARDSMGFCPQHNILFDELTVREHILFYSCLKGLSTKAAEAEVQKFAPLLELQDKLDALSSTLSGGMKRKLSVVIALCGQSKIVFLDEPTSGMDPGARRALWDILLAEKKDRTILLTTHFMDEADVLSDRIAILANGELKCAGSTFFLKKRFGTGYHLILVKNQNFDSNMVTHRLQMYIPNVRIESENDSEISYLLPEDKSDLFRRIFEDLEQNASLLKVQSFGVSLTTLEEIFLNIANSTKVNLSLQNGDQNASGDDSQILLYDQAKLVHGVPLMLNRAIALFMKRFLCWLHTWVSFICYNLFVILMLALVIFEIGNKTADINQNPTLDFTFDKYKSPYAIVPDFSVSKILPQYKAIIEHSPATLWTVNDTDMETSLLQLANDSLKEYRAQYITAADFFDNGTSVAWFNGLAIHSEPLSLNLMHNAIIKSLVGESYSINVRNAPFASKSETNNPTSRKDFAMVFPIFVGIVMSLLSPSYILFYIKENQSQAKFMQYASGANLFLFWGVSILWDLFTYLITDIIIVTLLAFGQHKNFSSASELAIVFSALLAYNIGMAPIVCILSLIFSKPTTGMNIISILNMVIVVVFLICVFFNDIPRIVCQILWFYPLCTLVAGLLVPGLKDTFGKKFDKTNFSSIDVTIELNILSMVVTGIIAYILLLAIEYGAFKWVFSFFSKNVRPNDPNDHPSTIDADVLAEKEQINRMSNGDLLAQAVVLSNVSKFYGNICAVNNISLSIKSAECFGLLGKNGAGKSSIFNMLTGQTMVSDGRILTKGFNQQHHLSQIYKIMGYCPQFDALLDGLSCRQTMIMFSLLRGIPTQDVRSYIENAARSLDFIQHIDKKVKQLSGGNKRKLSASLAMIGNLSVVLLDEPTSGMDPATKRNLWKVITRLREAGKSIVLTSHSMEECEALCTRMTVLVNGKCKCLGSSQHLKNKFCKGFELKIKVRIDDGHNNNDLTGVKNFVLQTFNGAIFREEYQGILTYSVAADNIKWSHVFFVMENAKRTLAIEDYSISQNTIEQVVLTLLKDQTEIAQP